MANPFIRRILFSGALCASAALLLTSCIDDSYDLDKVDLTMGLGSEGLAVKFGNTEKILLNDILETDNSVKIQNGTNLYYLVENGSTNIHMKVNKFTTSINDTKLNMNAPVLTYADVKQAVEAAGYTVNGDEKLPIKSGFSISGHAEGDERVSFNVKDVQDVSYINYLDIEDADVTLNLNTANSPTGMPFDVQKLENLKITIPKCLHVKEGSLAKGWTLGKASDGKTTLTCTSMTYSNPKICSMLLDKVVLNRAPKENQIHFTEDELTMHMEGKVTFGASRNFDMGKSDVASVRLDIAIGNQQGSSLEKLLTVKQVTGRFTPAIDPTVDPIDISGSLPDFLKDEEVEIDVANPTLHFHSDFTNIPVGVDLSGTVTSEFTDNTKKNKTITLPKQSFDENANNTVYYYQGDKPYDPTGLPATYKSAKVDDLGTLIEKLPEQIKVDLKNGQVAVKDKEYTIELGKEYAADANYNVYVPFEFNKGLTIVYRDSTNSMNDDLKDYSAEGIRVNGTAQNAIPLDLVVTLEAHDVDGNIIPGITFTTVKVKAGSGESTTNAQGEQEWNVTETPIEIEASLADPKLLSKVDKIFFKVNADNKETTQSHKLVSTQYLRVANIKLRLKGAVTADFN